MNGQWPRVQGTRGGLRHSPSRAGRGKAPKAEPDDSFFVRWERVIKKTAKPVRVKRVRPRPVPTGWRFERVTQDGGAYTGDAVFIEAGRYNPPMAVALMDSLGDAIRWLESLEKQGGALAGGFADRTMRISEVRLPSFNGRGFALSPPYYVVRAPDGYPRAYALTALDAESLVAYFKGREPDGKRKVDG